jgi:hypothetical protein
MADEQPLRASKPSSRQPLTTTWKTTLRRRNAAWLPCVASSTFRRRWAATSSRCSSPSRRLRTNSIKRCSSSKPAIVPSKHSGSPTRVLFTPTSAPSVREDAPNDRKRNGPQRQVARNTRTSRGTRRKVLRSSKRPRSQAPPCELRFCVLSLLDKAANILALDRDASC